MGQVLHGSATTTEAVRRAIHHSQASLRTLAKRYGINPKTVAKWRQRASVADQRIGPKHQHSTVLSPEDEAVVVAFRRHTLLPLAVWSRHLVERVDRWVAEALELQATVRVERSGDVAVQRGVGRDLAP